MELASRHPINSAVLTERAQLPRSRLYRHRAGTSCGKRDQADVVLHYRKTSTGSGWR